jgi:hypothetical protein
MAKYWPIRKCQVTKPSDVKSCLERTGDSRNRLNTYQGLAKQAENKLPFAATLRLILLAALLVETVNSKATSNETMNSLAGDKISQSNKIGLAPNTIRIWVSVMAHTKLACLGLT